MSSIIDALKKSDKNRTNESGANLNQIKFGDQTTKKSRRAIGLLLLLLVLVAAGVYAWIQGWHNKPIAMVNSWFETAPTEAIEPETQASEKNPAAETNKATTQQGAVASNNKLTPPKADEVKAKRQAVEQEQAATDQQKNQQLAVTASRNTKNNSNQELENDMLTKQNIVSKTQHKKQQQKAPDDANENSEQITQQKAEQIAKQNRQDLEPTIKQDYLLVHQIDFEIRKNIPPIKLNIHIFDPDPENRMVILNGVKYIIGDTIEEIVVVKEINQQGVVLTFEGIKFLIPK